MAWLFVDAIDVLFFRDGRPFEAGEEHIAQSLFPPNSSTVLGAIRGSIFRRMCRDRQKYLDNDTTEPWVQELNAAMGRPDRLGPMSIPQGPFVASWDAATCAAGSLYFPPPADVVRLRREDRGFECTYLRPLRDGPQLWGADPDKGGLPPGLLPMWARTPRVAGGLGGEDAHEVLISRCGLERMLAGTDFCSGVVVASDELLSNDTRAGNALENRQVKEAHLYEASFVRPGTRERRVGLAFSLTHEGGDDELPGISLVQLGGEGRWATVTSLTHDSPLPAAADLQRGPDGKVRFKVYLATPCVLEGGWLPDWIDAKTLKVICPRLPMNSDTSLVSVALADKTAIGGYDLARGIPRASHAAVGAGSVYFFETSAPPEWVAGLHLSHFLDSEVHGETQDMPPDQQRQLGLGLSFIGGWDYA